MEIFSTSHDLVNLALTIGIIGVSAAIVYFFIVASNFIRELHRTIDELNRQLETISQITESIKGKLSFMVSYWAILEKVGSKVIDLFQNKMFSRIKDKIFHSSTKKHKKSEEENDLDNNQIEVEPKSETKVKTKAKIKKSKKNKTKVS